MKLQGITFKGPAADPQLLEALPASYKGRLAQLNGFVAFNGGLHIRGACSEPSWHSLKLAVSGTESIQQLFSSVFPDDIPFGQDCMGDQYLLRNGIVHKLYGETAEIESLELKLSEFFSRVEDDPIGYLGLEPLLQFQKDGGVLEPGQLLNAYPPFVFKESANGVSLKAVPVAEQLRFLSDLAKQLASLPEGQAVQIKVVP
ncbi:hypothetical protein [Nevskia ramosa]|uniref:hypothetical protein n=1 Tax=Nevskia ramosa TaxID=64002 RepID=UPI003D109AE6